MNASQVASDLATAQATVTAQTLELEALRVRRFDAQGVGN